MRAPDLVELIERRIAEVDRVRTRHAPDAHRYPNDYLAACGGLDQLRWVLAQIIGEGNVVVKQEDRDELEQIRALSVRFVKLSPQAAADVNANPDVQAVPIVPCPICGANVVKGMDCRVCKP